MIDIAGVSHAFGTRELSREVLSNLNLTVARGEIVMLTGPSGSGKSTLLTLVAGLRAVQAGSCIVLGQQLRGAVEAQRIALRRRIGFVFQDHHLLGFLTAAQNVAMSLEPSVISGRERRARSGAILKAVGLGGHLDAIPDQLSGGQRQRVSIARALVREPELIIADEPTASLDSRSGREVVELIARLARIRKAAVLIVTHDLRILEVADRVVALEDGRISETSVHG